MASLASGTPLSGRGATIGKSLENGQVASLFNQVPPASRQLLNHVVKGSFTSALDLILLIAAIFAFVAGGLPLALIRSRDFASGAAHTAPAH